jgi:hypothetical protein
MGMRSGFHPPQPDARVNPKSSLETLTSKDIEIERMQSLNDFSKQ